MRNFEDEIPDWENTPLKKNRQIKALVIARQEAANQIAELETTKKDCSDKLLTILSSAGVEKARVDQFAVSVVTTERETLSQGELKKALLEHKFTKDELKAGGLSLQTIEKLWEKCSSKSSSSYVKVTERKG